MNELDSENTKVISEKNAYGSNIKRQILIVEDEPVNFEMLNMYLESDYKILHAVNGAQAEALIQEYYETISVVLLDLILPDAHGLTILNWIVTDRRYARIPVIVMTSDKESEVQCLNVGASDFISKPYPSPNVIQARVRRTIEFSENRDLIRQTERDGLTGLYNRDFFYRYARLMDLHQKDSPMDAIVLDINHFHMINERHGLQFADEALRRIGIALCEETEALGGIGCRLEADTFLVYCPHLAEPAAFLDEIIARIGQDMKTRIRLRMGIYCNVDRTINMERRFDRAKLAGDSIRSSYTKNIAVYDERMNEKELFEERLLEEFHDAIKQKQFLVYCQPKFDIRPVTPQLYGAEALVRWNHPELGMISPGVFIPLFESNGLIRELDHYVWRETAAKLHDWVERLGFAVPVSVNVSRIDMMDAELADTLQNLVREFNLDYSLLHLEITESAYTQDSVQIIETVKRLREMGFIIEMDDFGSGYSSLNMISTLPIDVLKLDMAFIRNAFSENGNIRMLEVTFDIAGILGVPMIAEGVETAEQMLTLRAMGCDIVQGYYFSRPLPMQEFELYLLESKMNESDTIVKNSAAEANGKKSFHEKFNYDKLRDPVTGMYNQEGFDMLFKCTDTDRIVVIDSQVKFAEMKNHEEWETAIRLVAETMRSAFRSKDMICHVADEEFIIVMNQVTSPTKGMIEEKFSQLNQKIAPDALIGGVAFSVRKNPGEDIVEDARVALQQAKKTLKQGCVFYGEE